MIEQNVFLSKILKYGLLLLVSAIFVVCIFMEDTDYICKNNYLVSNFSSLLIFIILLCVTYKWVIKPSYLSNYDKKVVCLVVLLFFAQVYIFTNIYFISGWDPATILGDAISYVNGMGISNPGYFSKCTNNIPMLLLEIAILKINGVLGVYYGERVGLSLVIINSLINCFTCYLIYRVASIFSKKKIAFMTFIISIILIGISGWTVVIYTDAITLFIPILSIFLYYKQPSSKETYLFYRCISVFIAMMGFFIKPVCIIPMISIGIIEIMSLVFEFSKDKIIRCAIYATAMLVSFILLEVVLLVGQKKVDLSIDNNLNLGISHYLMLGMNEKTEGIFSSEDLEYSLSFDNQQSRIEGNIAKINERVSKMGVFGLTKLFTKKILNTYNDASFSWGREGTFYLFTFDDINSSVCPFLKKIYGCGTEENRVFITIQQVIWIGTLFTLITSCLNDSDVSPIKNVLRLTLIGVILYQLLFESRARYIYIFVPLIVLLSAEGIDFIFKKMELIKKKLQHNK